MAALDRPSAKVGRCALHRGGDLRFHTHTRQRVWGRFDRRDLRRGPNTVKSRGEQPCSQWSHARAARFRRHCARSRCGAHDRARRFPAGQLRGGNECDGSGCLHLLDREPHGPDRIALGFQRPRHRPHGGRQQRLRDRNKQRSYRYSSRRGLALRVLPFPRHGDFGLGKYGASRLRARLHGHDQSDQWTLLEQLHERRHHHVESGRDQQCRHGLALLFRSRQLFEYGHVGPGDHD